MRRIETIDDLADGLAALRAQDPRLEPVISAAGEVPLRRLEPGFASLCSIVISQQVSRASADAIFTRFVPADRSAVSGCGPGPGRRAPCRGGAFRAPSSEPCWRSRPGLLTAGLNSTGCAKSRPKQP